MCKGLKACKGEVKMEKIRISSFGETKDKKKVFKYTLTNRKGMEVDIISYGAAVVAVRIPNGEMTTDVALGYDSIADYEAHDKYMGAVVGRFANRIGSGKFILNEKEYDLAVNNGKNHLHGGISGFDKKVWKGEIKGDAVVFAYISPDGEEGYPAELRTEVTYSLTDEGELGISYEAIADGDTIINLTNHTYFNLNGQGQITNHILKINADRFTENNEESLPTGKILSVENTPFDFRKSKEIGENINDTHYQIVNGKGYDHNFIVNGQEDMKFVSQAHSPKTKISMEVYSTQVGVQFYSGNYIDGRVKGKRGVTYKERDGFCLETQGFPNAIAVSSFPSPILRKNTKYCHKTIYKFFIK